MCSELIPRIALRTTEKICLGNGNSLPTFLYTTSDMGIALKGLETIS